MESINYGGIFFFLWCFHAAIAISPKLHILNFAESSAIPGEPLYYLEADADTSHVGPTDELKRMQRSLWKKLFKNSVLEDLFCNDCNYNNNNNYDAGNGDNAPPADPYWYGLPPLPPLLPLPPLPFGLYGGGYSPKGALDYANNQQNNQQNDEPPAPSYSDEEPPKSNPNAETYEAPATYNTPNVEPTEITAPSQPELPGPSYSSLPQILYQPIIYVSPQYQPSAEKSYNAETSTPLYENAANPNYQESSKLIEKKPYGASASPVSGSYNDAPASPASSLSTNNAAESYSTIATKPYLNIEPQAAPEYTATPCNGQQYQPSYSVEALQPARPKIVSSITILTPAPETPALGGGCGSQPNHFTGHSASFTARCAPMTNNDQPYRACPELFSEYNRAVSGWSW